jgi:NAD(P)-dependent dehydrogenase (short-subunit alcohol dehydrogenase family)
VDAACRSEKTGKETAARLKADVGRQDLSLVPMVLDLADLESIQRFANEFQSQYKKVDILVNNAAEGIGSSTKTQTKHV